MNKRIFLIIFVLFLIGTIIFVLEQQKVSPGSFFGGGVQVNENEFPLAPEFNGVSGFLNTNKQPTLSDLRGKVVLVDFWTYSCINCIRTLPFLNAWYEKYHDKGLVIIGVHTPEFDFEKKKENVRQALEQYHIQYIVIQDNDYVNWRLYQGGTGYWPRKYLIDAEGRVRYDHIGEGAYEETEQKIQELLAEAGNDVSDMGTTALEDETPRLRQTPELYAGYDFALPRGQDIGNKGGLKAGEIIDYVLPEPIKEDIIYLEGKWKSNRDHLKIEDEQQASVVLLFTSTAVNMVADSLSGRIELDVFLDGKYLTKEQAGKDISFDEQRSFVVIDEPRLYNIFRGDYGSYTLKLTTISQDFTFNAFTFG